MDSLSGVIQRLLGAASTRWRISMPRLECVTSAVMFHCSVMEPITFVLKSTDLCTVFNL